MRHWSNGLQLPLCIKSLKTRVYPPNEQTAEPQEVLSSEINMWLKSSSSTQ